MLGDFDYLWYSFCSVNLVIFMVKNFIACLLISLPIVLYPAKSLSSEKEYNPNDLITTTNAVDALWYLLKEKYPESHKMHSYFKFKYKEEGYPIAFNQFVEDFNKCDAGLELSEVIRLRKLGIYIKSENSVDFIGREPIIKAMCQGKSLNQVEQESK